MESPVSKLRETTKADVVAWVERWKAVSPFLEKERKNQIRATNTAESVEFLHNGLEIILEKSPPIKKSGLEIMQKFFMKHSFYESAR